MKPAKTPLRRWFLALFACFLLAVPGRATWSIVAVDRRTGEVCVASATCIPRSDLTLIVPVIVVGKGGGVTQSVVDGIENRQRIRAGLESGATPAEILALIESLDDGFRQRQIGIVDFANAPVSFTGRAAGAAKKSVVGEQGDLVYAIQGNVLAGDEVIDQCELALLESTGDLGQRVLAAMVRAREFGGDGRCSCQMGRPDDCGSPPEDFEKSAHCGFLLLARMGDPDGSCEQGEGCANGRYHMRLNVRGGNALENDPDPVDQLVGLHAAWRAERRGRPDGLLSRVESVDSVPADGLTTRTVRVELVDLEGVPLEHGGALVEVASADGGPTLVDVGPVRDHGDGSYSFELRAGTRSGSDRLAIRASDDLVSATLYPYLEVRSDPAGTLHAGFDRVSAGAGAEVPFVVSAPDRPRGKYWLVASLAGAKRRGFGLDPGLLRGVVPAELPFFPGPPGELDRAGRAEALYRVAPGALLPLVGLRLEWTARIFSHGPPLLSETVGFEIGP
jgi:hypothetical protein